MPSIFSGLNTFVQRHLLHPDLSEIDMESLLSREYIPDNWGPVVETDTATEFSKEQVKKALDRSTEHLLSLQKDDHWVFEAEANVSLAAQYIITRHYIGLPDPVRETKIINYLKKKQSKDGSWPLYWDGPGELGTTIESYFAAKLAGVSPKAPFMKKARKFILDSGGIESAKAITRLYLALFGCVSWDWTPSLPVTLMLLPSWMPFNIYDMSYWARTCTVPLLVVWHRKKVRSISSKCRVDELFTGCKDTGKPWGAMPPLLSWAHLFDRVDDVLRTLDKLPPLLHRRTAEQVAEKWILDHQDEDGSWGGIFPAITHSIMGLHNLGYPNDHPVMVKALSALEDLMIEEDDDSLHLQPCVSPVWDTAWAIIALVEAGVSPDEPKIQKATEWLYDQQIHRPGDWAIKTKRNIPPGGWAFQYHNDFYPDTDDSAVVLLALLYSNNRNEPDRREAFDRGVKWLLGMQNKDGGWPAFELDVHNPLFDEVRYNADKNLHDPSTVDVSGRVIEALGRIKCDIPKVVERARAYIASEQEEDGKWWGRWGVNYVYGTWSALCGLRALGCEEDQPMMDHAAEWLESVQNPDGGWGESCRSYCDPRWAGRGTSTASQTAWGVMGLLAAGASHKEASLKGIKHLLATQTDEGCWDENPFTGTGFPSAFYLRYHGYSVYFPLMALARYQKAMAALKES